MEGKTLSVRDLKAKTKIFKLFFEKKEKKCVSFTGERFFPTGCVGLARLEEEVSAQSGEWKKNKISPRLHLDLDRRKRGGRSKKRKSKVLFLSP